MLHVSLKFTRFEHGYFIKIWNNDYFTRTLWHDLSSLSKDYRINGALSPMRERGEGRKRLNSFRNTYHTNAVWNLWYQKLQSAWEICRDQIYLLNSLQRQLPPKTSMRISLFFCSNKSVQSTSARGRALNSSRPSMETTDFHLLQHESHF